MDSGKRKTRHHTVPQLLLSNFTDANGDLFEFDLDTLKRRRKKPGGVAHQKDFYTVDIEGEPSDEVENILADLESRSASAVKKLSKIGETLVHEDWDALVMLVALQKQRTQSARDPMLDFLDRIESTARHMVRSQGLDEEEAMADLLRQNEETRGRTFINSYLLTSLVPVYRLMRRRSWSIMRRADNAPRFVISDNPVVISDLREEKEPPYYPLIPYGPDSRLAMPISPDITLVSIFEGDVIEETAAPSFVAEYLNFQQLQQARRRVYGNEENFRIGTVGEQIFDWLAWVEDQKQVRKEQGWSPSYS